MIILDFIVLNLSNEKTQLKYVLKLYKHNNPVSKNIMQLNDLQNKRG